MATTAIPTLTTKGYVSDLTTMCDKIMSYFYTVNTKQSNYLFPNAVKSLNYFLGQYGNDPLQLCSQLKSYLMDYLNSYFDNSSVECTTNSDDPTNDTNRYVLTIAIEVLHQGTTISFIDEIYKKDNTFEKIIKRDSTG